MFRALFELDGEPAGYVLYRLHRGATWTDGLRLDVLELLAREPRPVPTMTIARECGIPKSSAHQLLNVMRARGCVTYHERERTWGLGVAMFRIGASYLRSGPLQRLGRQLLEELTERTGETSHLAVLRGTDVLYVDKEQPVGDGTSLVTEVGVRLPAHLTAVGRAILAELPPAQLASLYGDGPLARRTARGPRTLRALRRELREVSMRGYALDREMVTPGISCLAAPVFDHEGVPVAAIGVTFLSAQRSGAQIESAARVTCEVASRLSAALGHAPVPALEGVAG
jgi:DNA-binding IclR family transcriptional regulator